MWPQASRLHAPVAPAPLAPRLPRAQPQPNAAGRFPRPFGPFKIADLGGDGNDITIFAGPEGKLGNFANPYPRMAGPN